MKKAMMAALLCALLLTMTGCNAVDEALGFTGSLVTNDKTNHGCCPPVFCMKRYIDDGVYIPSLLRSSLPSSSKPGLPISANIFFL